jgi:hypothetical protein
MKPTRKGPIRRLLAAVREIFSPPRVRIVRR